MGLKKTNYTFKGLTIDTAYAMIGDITIKNDTALVIFYIHLNRNSLLQNLPLEYVHFKCIFDRSKPVYEQIYQQAKKEIFIEWEDDIAKK